MVVETRVKTNLPSKCLLPLIVARGRYRVKANSPSKCRLPLIVARSHYSWRLGLNKLSFPRSYSRDDLVYWSCKQ